MVTRSIPVNPGVAHCKGLDTREASAYHPAHTPRVEDQDTPAEAQRVTQEGSQWARRSYDLGQKLYDGYHGVMLGVKSITWAMSRKVGGWQSLAYVPMETNYEHVS